MMIVVFLKEKSKKKEKHIPKLVRSSCIKRRKTVDADKALGWNKKEKSPRETENREKRSSSDIRYERKKHWKE